MNSLLGIIFITVLNLIFNVPCIIANKSKDRNNKDKISDEIKVIVAKQSVLLDIQNYLIYKLHFCECKDICSSSFEKVTCEKNGTMIEMEKPPTSYWSKCKIHYEHKNKVSDKSLSNNFINFVIPKQPTYNKKSNSLEMVSPTCEKFTIGEQFKLKCTSIWCETENAITATFSKAQHKSLRNSILPSTSYNITIRLKEPYNLRVQFRDVKLFSSVKKLKANCVTNDTIFLEWETSIYLNNITIKKYVSQEKNSPMKAGMKAKMTECEFEKNFTCAKIRNLQNSTLYTIALYKRNSRELLGIIAKTTETDNPSLANLTIIWSRSKITLQWMYNNDTRCVPETYEVIQFDMNNKSHTLEVKSTKDLFESVANVGNITKEPLRHSFEIRSNKRIKRFFGTISVAIYHYRKGIRDPFIEYCYKNNCTLSIPKQYNITESMIKNGSIKPTLVYQTNKYSNFQFTNFSLQYPALIIDHFLIKQRSTPKNRDSDNKPRETSKKTVSENYPRESSNKTFSDNNPKESSKKTEGRDSIKKSALVSIACLGILLATLFMAALYFWRKKVKQTNSLPPHSSSFYKKPSNFKLTGVRTTRPKIPDPPHHLDDEKEQLLDNKLCSKPVEIDKLEDYILASLDAVSGANSLSWEFFNCCAVNKPCEFGKMARNLPKNRYNNLIPYDENRVKLTSNGPNNDYINASYINGYIQGKAFIATQEPQLNTIDDFWLMVAQEKITTIVMLSTFDEAESELKTPYWPEMDVYRIENISIVRKDVKHFADYVQRTFTITFSENSWDIRHFQYLAWPKNGIPLYPHSFAPFLKKLLAIPQSGTPILVHCNSGCGRTGTLILCDIVLRMAAKQKKVDFWKTLNKLRQQRTLLVQTLDQYIFAHLVVLECLTHEDFSIAVNEDFENAIRHVLRTKTVKPLMVQADKVTQRYLKRLKPRDILSEDDKAKNRFSDILPLETSQVLLTGPQQESEMYINAVSVDYYRCPGKFIVTQQPLQETVEDFWNLIQLYEINTIVSLNEIPPNDPSCPLFWQPTENVQIIDVNNSNIYDFVKIKLRGEVNRTVHIIQMKNWLRTMTKPSELRDLIEVWRKMYRTSWKGDSKIVVTCYDGTTACGLFVALAFILEQMKLENVCDIFAAVRTVRQSRPGFVQDWAQFEFLHKAALEYYQEFLDYENFRTK